MNTNEWRTRWENAFIYGLVCTIMVCSTLFAISAYLNSAANELALRVDRNAAVAVEEARTSRELLCDILSKAQTKQIRKAVKAHCPEVT